LLVLISSIYISRYQRVKESVLLRTLGASRKQVIKINTLEYLYLGLIATFTGLVISVVASYLLALFYFEVPFAFNFLPILATLAIITALVVVLGWANSRTVVNQPPLEVLRKEVG
jgi:putative ABC transport system permease protein